MKAALIAVLFVGIFSNLDAQELIYDEGIYCEKAISNDTSEHRYSLNNITYNVNDVFIFDYYYIDSIGNKWKFISKEAGALPDNLMRLTNIQNLPDNGIDKISLTVTDNLNIFLKHDSTYTQTVFKYEYLNKSGKMLNMELTGIVDNRVNLWMHPPRSENFKILEINPFPFYNLADTTIQWQWKLKVGSHWADTRWKTWKGSINLIYQYTRLKDETIKTGLGEVKCKVTQGAASSEIGTTYLTSYYHQKFGFVRLEYTNINATKLVMELIEYKPGKR